MLERSVSRRRSPVLVTTSGAAAVVGLLLLRRQPLSWDEAVTAAVATRTVPQILGTLHHSDAVLGVYYAMMHGWSSTLTAVGVRLTESWWRLPSAAAAVATCGVVASCARRAAGMAAALSAGLFLAVMPLFAFYAVDARPYTSSALAVTSAWWAWTRPGGERTLRWVAVTGVLLALAAWLQLFSVLVWPAFLLVGGRRGTRSAVAMLTAATVAVAPLSVIAVTQSSEIAWIPAATPVNTARVVLHIGGGSAVVVALVALAVAVARTGQVRLTSMTAAALWWAVAPTSTLVVLDAVRPVLVARYALVSLPMVAIGFGVVVGRFGERHRRPDALRVAGVAAVTAAVATSAWQGLQPFKYEDYRAAAAFSSRAVAPGTPVLYAPSSARLGVQEYLKSSTLVDVALPSGVGNDPLALGESNAAAVGRAAARSCYALVIGDPVATDSPGRVRSAPVAVARWTVEAARSFGLATVTVVRNPTCDVAATDTRDQLSGHGERHQERPTPGRLS